MAGKKRMDQWRSLLAALLATGWKSFTKEDIAVEAWKAFPDVFCIAGYPQYPDTRKIAVLLYGLKGLIARGYLPIGADYISRHKMLRTLV